MSELNGTQEALDSSQGSGNIASSPRFLSATRVNLGLAVIVGCLFVNFVTLHARSIRFLLTRAVPVEGFTLHLDPRDRFITLDILEHGTYERAETSVVRGILRPGDTFVDVGANIGWFTLVASRAVGDGGKVVAFEPAPFSFDLLRRNARENRCDNAVLEEVALSNKAGTIPLNLGDQNKGHNSFLKTEDTKDRVDVRTIPLDDYLASRPDIGAIDLVKIDVEGAEGFVLDGMKATLRKNPGLSILMEYFPTLLKQAGYEPVEMLRKFQAAGYEVLEIDDKTGTLSLLDASRIPSVVATLETTHEHINVLIKPKAGTVTGATTGTAH